MEIISPTASDELWNAYQSCRYRTLYQPFNLPETCGHSEADTPRVRPDIIHACAVVDGKVVACGRMDLQPDHPKGPRAQLRYFGLDAEQRGKGIAQAMLRYLEDGAKGAGLTHIWMEARVAAAGFYARAGYADAGEGPTKWGVIPHRIMERTL
ncbi:MAG: GNAT family N-acetyltransferase [Phycisphaerales bacterium]